MLTHPPTPYEATQEIRCDDEISFYIPLAWNNCYIDIKLPWNLAAVIERKLN